MTFIASLYYWGQKQNRIKNLLEMHLHNEKIRDSNVGFSVGLKKRALGILPAATWLWKTGIENCMINRLYNYLALLAFQHDLTFLYSPLRAHLSLSLLAVEAAWGSESQRAEVRYCEKPPPSQGDECWQTFFCGFVMTCSMKAINCIH